LTGAAISGSFLIRVACEARAGNISLSSSAVTAFP
jgi:hypothetical protein